MLIKHCISRAVVKSLTDHNRPATFFCLSAVILPRGSWMNDRHISVSKMTASGSWPQ